MEPVPQHSLTPDVSFDGGELDCGGGLLLLIRRHIDPMERGGLLEILSTDASVEQDLPSWCRLTANELVSWTKQDRRRSYLVCKGSLVERAQKKSAPGSPAAVRHPVVPVTVPEKLPAPVPAPVIEPLSVMGMGSWPRPRWMLQAIHDHLQGRVPEAEFQATADDAVRLAVEAQLRAGVDVVTDGEQRRDSYASFVGALLDNCQLIPLTDLSAMVDHPDEFENELRALDVPAADVRHPVMYGPLGRSRPLALHEFEFAKSITSKPVKVALPGPYLLTRTMWLDCLTERPYESREELAREVVRVLREELHFLLAAGVALVQFDEPVLTEVVFTGAKAQRSFMCGALSEKKSAAQELAFAADLLNDVVHGLPMPRLALHICRGNWTRDERAVLSGDYRPLLGLLRQVRVGTLFLELCTARAGEMEVLRDLPEDRRVGVGVVNQKLDRVETVEEVAVKAEKAIRLFGKERVLLTPDCGFATFADNPVSAANVAEAKLRQMAQARDRLREESVKQSQLSSSGK
jgi:5-methyltetrahydropteroyltriglutamate--homocysteine methyltransferase